VDSLYLLVPLSVMLVLGLIAIFAWALFSDQFEDLRREGERILDDDARPDAGLTRVKSAPVPAADTAAPSGEP
jgi:cbb3-type cytochrome oxidase maturation protein